MHGVIAVYLSLVLVSAEFFRPTRMTAQQNSR